jgi:hypothetical protein
MQIFVKQGMSVSQRRNVMWRADPLLGQRPRNKQRDNSCCFVTAGKHVNDIRATARQPPISTIEEMLGAVFTVGSAPELYNEELRPAQLEFREFSCGILAGQEGSERGKLKNLHC